MNLKHHVPLNLQLDLNRALPDERMTLRLEHHQATYPRHRIYKKAEVIRQQLRIKRLLDGIKWDDGGSP